MLWTQLLKPKIWFLAASKMAKIARLSIKLYMNVVMVWIQPWVLLTLPQQYSPSDLLSLSFLLTTEGLPLLLCSQASVKIRTRLHAFPRFPLQLFLFPLFHSFCSDIPLWGRSLVSMYVRNACPALVSLPYWRSLSLDWRHWAEQPSDPHSSVMEAIWEGERGWR